MNLKEIQELIKLISKSNLTEFKYRKGDVQLTVRTKKFAKNQQVMGSAPASIVHVPQQAQPVAPAPAPVAASTPPAQTSEAKGGDEKGGATNEAHLVEIKSPIVGTFYRSSSPEKPPFLKVGDRVEVGQVVCIVEAMKLFNEIESEVSGEIIKVIPEDASPVEYDQVLFLVDPTK